MSCHLYHKIFLRFKRGFSHLHIAPLLHLLVMSWIATIISFMLTLVPLDIAYIISNKIIIT
ncbi:Multidrug resistance MdtO [Gossypium arboreum]|uniref:Multidrug resistance MdtO n=1 Tax=Gossypium arboreum TaxID=29729 RepID=A0A0B0PSJ2_GOSAR|nr:Multidrug resistance MdtO [Gossypium arboreum]